MSRKAGQEVSSATRSSCAAFTYASWSLNKLPLPLEPDGSCFPPPPPPPPFPAGRPLWAGRGPPPPPPPPAGG
eukprot:SAG11_NODE_11097_length_783_cov_5.470760_1_plen_72_part_10